MELTEKDKSCILDLCGTKGNIRKGVLFLHMMYECTDEEALAAVKKTRKESQATTPEQSA